MGGLDRIFGILGYIALARPAAKSANTYKATDTVLNGNNLCKSHIITDSLDSVEAKVGRVSSNYFSGFTAEACRFFLRTK